MEPAVSDLPILSSFRRCPYAMRARLAIQSSGQRVALQEIPVVEQKRVGRFRAHLLDQGRGAGEARGVDRAVTETSPTSNDASGNRSTASKKSFSRTAPRRVAV